MRSASMAEEEDEEARLAFRRAFEGPSGDVGEGEGADGDDVVAAHQQVQRRCLLRQMSTVRARPDAYRPWQGMRGPPRSLTARTPVLGLLAPSSRTMQTAASPSASMLDDERSVAILSMINSGPASRTVDGTAAGAAAAARPAVDAFATRAVDLSPSKTTSIVRARKGAVRRVRVCRP